MNTNRITTTITTLLLAVAFEACSLKNEKTASHIVTKPEEISQAQPAPARVQQSESKGAGLADKYATTSSELMEEADIALAETPNAAGSSGPPMLRKSKELVKPGSMGLTPQQRYNPNFNTESYDRIYENRFLEARSNPLSTFSIDVDTASYSNVRRFLSSGTLPPRDAVRIEELVNYFDYDYAEPTDNRPFAVNTEVTKALWDSERTFVRIGLKGKSINSKELPPRNLVFLLDVSGSMSSANKLPLLKKAMKLLVQQLSSKDRVAIVVYAGSSGLVLPPTSGDNSPAIMSALDRLQAGGSTNGGQGIELAYKIARENYEPQAVNRVILATDGDFNIGTTGQGDLIRLIEEERKSGVFLTVLGFGMGNYKDSTMEKLADKGNGNYAYIDNFAEARKTLLTEAASTLITIAKDVKIQVEFNPSKVKAYRLIGYENRVLNKEDFNDDKKDAGEIGAGHTVTALYEIVPVGGQIDLPEVDKLKYQKPPTANNSSNSNELLTVKIRYKEPQSEHSQLLTYPVSAGPIDFALASPDTRFSAAVAGFGMMLRDSEYKQKLSYDLVYQTAKNALGEDRYGYRGEFLRLVRMSEGLSTAVN